MPRGPRSLTTAASLLTAGGLLIGGVAPLSGCGTPPELRDPQARPSSVPPTAPVTPSAPATLPNSTATGPLPGLTTPALSDFTAVDCHGKPSATQIIALLRRADLLASGAKVTVVVAPVCAADWQYTVVQIPDREPLQVVSKGEPGALTMVTAGTDVCTIPVRTEGPPGIQTRACTEGPFPTAGA